MSLINAIAKEFHAENPRLDAELLLCHVLKMKKEALLFSDINLTNDQKLILAKLIERRNSGEPLEYLISQTQFYGFDFFITPDVLIPRPETELLVSLAIDSLPRGGSVLDMGAGSGCIGISIALSRKNLKVHAIEKSKSAVEVIEKNYLKHKVKNFSFERADISDFKGKNYDLVVSNPPYVSYLDHLDDEVKNYEPWEALFSGMTGLECIQKWSKLSHDFLKPKGIAIFEIGYGQKTKAKEFFEKNGFDKIELINDLHNMARIIKAKTP